MNAISFVKSILFAGIALPMCFLCASCGEEQVYVRQSSGEVAAGLKEAQRSAVKGGVAITFDDAHIDEWCSILDLLDRYDAKVTFFVTHWDKLDSEQIRKLKVLQNAGHEIACHGLRHKSVKDYDNSISGLHKYLDEEVIPAIKIMKDNGFTPLNFAYSRGERTLQSDLPLLQYFHYLRGIYYDKSEDIPYSDYLYYKCDSDKKVIGALSHSYCQGAGSESLLITALSDRDSRLLWGYFVEGLNVIDLARREGLPVTKRINSVEIRECLSEPIQQIVESKRPCRGEHCG